MEVTMPLNVYSSFPEEVLPPGRKRKVGRGFRMEMHLSIREYHYLIDLTEAWANALDSHWPDTEDDEVTTKHRHRIYRLREWLRKQSLPTKGEA